MKNNLVSIDLMKGRMVVSSRQVAEDFKKRHNDTVEAIDVLVENLTTENLVVKNYFIEGTFEHRGNIYRQYFMTRDGFSLLVMGFNGKEAFKFKIRYIEAFNMMEKAILERNSSDWLLMRKNGKLVRRNETDAIQKLIPYAREQGSKNADKLYMTYSKLVNSTVGLKAKQRDIATWEQLQFIRLLEDMVTRTIEEEMENSVYYKEIYQICKRKAQQFAGLTYLIV